MRILALEPYYGGSHRAFLDGWAAHSRHEWTAWTLPAYKWKWRMRHAAVTFARRILHEPPEPRPDVLLCSDMLDLATFLGLARPVLGPTPAVAYFHESQPAYPVRRHDPRDEHFAFTNFTTALAARRVWFNSAFHRRTFLDALDGLLRRMPDYRCLDAAASIEPRSAVFPPGIDPPAPRPPRLPGPLRILWAARWEYDKGPETFFRAVELLARRGAAFRLSVLGPQFRTTPPVFAEARARLAGHIDRWGYLPSRRDYLAALAEADVFVSTAEHEFFGIAAVEAVAAGARPLLPDRLAYPEVLAPLAGAEADRFLYDGTAEDLAGRLADLARQVEECPGPLCSPALARRAVECYGWRRAAPRMDDALDRLAAGRD